MGLLKLGKAQIFSFDAIIAVITFVVILLSSIWIWDYSREKIYLTERRYDLELISKNVLSVLVETPGNPANWTNISDTDFNQTNINSLGLARSSSHNNLNLGLKGRSGGLVFSDYLVLEVDKIERFDNLSSLKYDACKKILGILGPNYEFGIDVNVLNGSNYVTRYQIGTTVTPISKDIVRADRYALLNGTWTNVVFKVWQECGDAVC